ncbi:ABC transporter ATP-binding protein [Rhodococcus sp. T2V]|uniref:ABC transporter ATP-binding protein n=1 Tax=Rhodococcus sp. T2V TaxID=3034164 RepID=UPI0023E25F01|nr:ABC transporter ATP-binding protein [Rhodococcus sp. T2V]MDF3313222.1 ABC transporter ATP-binding protein [Rhodococcus sp. T2V]
MHGLFSSGPQHRSDAIPNSTGSHALEARGLVLAYGSLPVVRDVDISVDPGEIVVLVGANGAGKSTTLLGLAGGLPPVSGEVLLNGQPAQGALSQRSRDGFAYITEERCVLMTMTVEENLKLGAGGVDRAVDFMPELKPLLNRRVGLLSGGEQQMVALARALATNPSVIAADELSLGLAPLIVDRLMKVLRDAADHGVAVLIVEQQVRRALHLCDRGYVMRQGQVVIEGTRDELLARIDDVEHAYLSAAS